MASTLTPEIRAMGHTPEARRKAVATMKRNREKKLAEKKAEGTHSTIRVADIPMPDRKKKVSKAGKGRRTFTPAEKLGYVNRVEAALAKDRNIGLKDVLAKEGIHSSQLYAWQRQRKKLAKLAPNGTQSTPADLRALAAGRKLNGKKSLNGTVHPGAIGNGELARLFYNIDDGQVEVVVSVKGNTYSLTVAEALKLREGLASMGF